LRNEFLQNSDQLDNLLELNKVIGEDQKKVETAFRNLSSLGDLVAISDNLRFDEDKLNEVYTFLDDAEVDSLTKSTELAFMRSLTDKFATAPNRLDAIFANTDKLEVLDDLTSRLDRNLEGVKEEKGQINMLFNNLDYADDFLLIVNRFEGTKRDTVLQDIRSLVTSNPTRKDIIFANPSQVGTLRKLYEEFKFEPARVEVIFEFASKADAFLDVLNEMRASEGGFAILFTDTVSTMENRGLAKLKAEYAEEYWSVFDENKERAAEIAAVASKFKGNDEYLSLVFSNIDKLDEIQNFANEFGSTVVSDDGQTESFKFGFFELVVDPETNLETLVFIEDYTLINIFFANINNLTRLNDFKMIAEAVGIPGGDALVTFNHDVKWLEFIIGQSTLEYDANGRPLLNEEQKKAAQFVGDLYFSQVALIEIPLTLAEELFALNLESDELRIVIVDLLGGPQVESPSTEPPTLDDPGGNADLRTLSFLLNHSFNGTINTDLIVSADIAMASSFFVESMETFESLSYLGQSMDDYMPTDESDIYDPSVDGSVTFPNNDDYAAADSPSDPNYESENLDGPQGVLGGRKLTFGAGEYDLSSIAHERLLFAATESLVLSGDITFKPSQADDVWNELLLISAGGLSFAQETSLHYEGESLGVGSFNQMSVIEVDLYAQDQISLRSLDRLVIKNSDLITGSNGIGGVELLAHQEISVDNLRFSEHVKRIAMEAMTVNLSNLNFPAGSQVKLNSAYGGLDGRYPNFNSILYGRVNFIQNIRYANNLMMDRPSFDQYGGSISIGRIGN
jgi:hypothetical protein